MLVSRRPLASAVGAAVLLLAAAGTAAAFDLTLGPPDPNPGEFVRADAPVYATAPDGWACHYLGTNERLVGHRCAFEEHAAQKSLSGWRTERVFEPIDDVVCQRGWFALIESPRGRGWVATPDIRTDVSNGDGHSLISGCDAFTWT